MIACTEWKKNARKKFHPNMWENMSAEFALVHYPSHSWWKIWKKYLQIKQMRRRKRKSKYGNRWWQKIILIWLTVTLEEILYFFFIFPFYTAFNSFFHFQCKLWQVSMNRFLSLLLLFLLFFIILVCIWPQKKLFFRK